jgi:hypothetical protein
MSSTNLREPNLAIGPLEAVGVPRGAPEARAALLAPQQDWSQKIRLAGLHRFAAAITLLNLVGHFYLGFEVSWAHPLAALATGYSLELLLELVDSRAHRRRARFLGSGVSGFVNFLLSAHISALAVSMLLYPNQRLLPVIFATAAAVCSKVVFRFWIEGRDRHFLNPSNFGISLTLVLFPWVGIAPPYQFTENISGGWDWALPLLIVCTGTFINYRFTSRLVLLGSWLAGFALQAVLRHLIFDTALLPSLGPMTGMAFLLFTFYMVTDPPTTPPTRRGQMVFGFSVAAVYGMLMALHVVFGLFFSLAIVCSVRGAALWLRTRYVETEVAVTPAPATASSRA